MDKNIIGQFGVGFYSSFMVADKVDVYTQSYKLDSPSYKWSSDGSVAILINFMLQFISQLVLVFVFFAQSFPPMFSTFIGIYNLIRKCCLFRVPVWVLTS